jgi:hypothetical protein
MSDEFLIFCLSGLASGLFFVLFTIGDIIEKMRRLKEDINLTRVRVAILEKLREEEKEDEECQE